MAWVSARYKTAANGGTWTPADMNAIQDDKLRAAGLVAGDLAALSVTPRKRKTIVILADQDGAGFTPFTGLDGNAAYAYEVEGFVSTIATASPTGQLRVRPNAVSDAAKYVQQLMHRVDYGGGAPGHNILTRNGTGLFIADYNGPTIVNAVQFRGMLQTKTGQGRRMWMCESVFDDNTTATPYQHTSWGFWDDTTTNLTSLQFVWPGIGAVLDGWMSLRAMAEA